MAQADTYRELIECPAARLGTALKLHRERLGLSLEEIAKRVDYTFTPVVLQMIEAGQYPLEPAQVLIAVWGYDADPDQMLPTRDALEIAHDRREFAAGPTIRELRHSFTAAGLLYEYMSFVYELRDVEVGMPVALRDPDLAVLANTIHWPIEEIREHLTVLMARWDEADPHEEHSTTRQNRTGVLGASIPVGLIERLHQNTARA